MFYSMPRSRQLDKDLENSQPSSVSETSINYKLLVKVQ